MAGLDETPSSQLTDRATSFGTAQAFGLIQLM
jgi:hypothetical protein